jgi:hypothetical protein
MLGQIQWRSWSRLRTNGTIGTVKGQIKDLITELKTNQIAAE